MWSDETPGDSSPCAVLYNTPISAVRLSKLFRNIINKDNDDAKNIEIPATSHNSKSTKKGQDCLKSLPERKLTREYLKN